MMDKRRTFTLWALSGLIVFAVLCSWVSTVYPESLHDVAQTVPFWLEDSTGAALSNADNGTVKMYRSQGDTVGTTVHLSYSGTAGLWRGLGIEHSEIYTLWYDSDDHDYVLLDSLFVPAPQLGDSTITRSECFYPGVIPSYALRDSIIHTSHFHPDSSYGIALSADATVPDAALSANVFLDSEFPSYFDTYAELKYDAKFDTTEANVIAPGDSSYIHFTLYRTHAAGDLFYYDADSARIVLLEAGTNGQVLKMTSGLPAWGADAVGAGGSATADSASTADGNVDFDDILDASGKVDAIADSSVFEAQLAATNSPTDGHYLTYDSANTGYEWVASGGGAGDAWGDAVDASIVPDTDDTYDLGSATHQFKDGHFDGTLEADAVTVGGTAVAVSGGAFHDGFSDFVANEHIDWTTDQGATNIHSGNYTDTNTEYTAGAGLSLGGTEFSLDAIADSVTAYAPALADSNAYAAGGYVTRSYFEANDTDTQLSQETVEDYAGGLWTGNTETRATVTYQTADNTLDIVVDDMVDVVSDSLSAVTWSTYITAGSNLSWDGSTLNASTGDGGDSWGDAVDSNIIPTGADDTYDLGSATFQFKDGYFDGTLEADAITVGGTPVAVSGGAFHDGFSDFSANEHIDWTVDQGATNIHSGNYTDTNTTYTAGDGLDLTGTSFSVDIAATNPDTGHNTSLKMSGGQIYLDTHRNGFTEDTITEDGGWLHVKYDTSHFQTGASGLQLKGSFIGTTETFGGGASGTYDAIVIGDDSHSHTSSTITLASTNLTDSADLLYETELDTEAELEGQLSDVTDVYTNNDFAYTDYLLRAAFADSVAVTASTELSDTADLLYETELDAFSELQTQISDKTLVNEEDVATIDANWVNTAYPWADNEVSDDLTLATVSGSVDMGGATSLELPNAANPTTDAEGEIAWDSNDDAIEVYSGDLAASVLIPIYYTINKTILQPDQVNDEVCIFKVDALLYPHGIVIDQLSITLPADGAYSMVFEEWSGDPPTAQNDIDTVTTGASDAYMEDGTPTDGTIDADDFIYLHVPDTDVDWVSVQIIFHVKEGN